MFLLSAVLLLVGAAHGFRAVPSRGRLRGRSHAVAMQLEASLPAQKKKEIKGNADAVKVSAETSAAKNPKVQTAAKFQGMKIGDRPTKKNTRRKIMNAKTYKRGGTPFDLAIHQDVSTKMSELFAGELVEQMKESPFRELVVGEGDATITFVLAKQFGFCWGVERSIELAWAARDAYPEKTMHITNELIHNPGVNELLGGMDINFMEKDPEAVGGKRFDTVGDGSCRMSHSSAAGRPLTRQPGLGLVWGMLSSQARPGPAGVCRVAAASTLPTTHPYLRPGDVVILPAFGASLEEMELLDAKGVTTVDTTCPWVSKVWTTVDKHERADMTSVIHGKYAHEEAIATASMAETYLIIKDMKQAQEVASYILGEEGSLTDEQFMDKYRRARHAPSAPAVTPPPRMRGRAGPRACPFCAAAGCLPQAAAVTRPVAAAAPMQARGLASL